MKKVLIAVNSDVLRESLTVLLLGAFEVRVCCQPEQIIHQYAQLRPDAMILDLTLTGIKYRDILQIGTARHTSFVLLTPYLDEALLREAAQAENAHILRLPCSENAVAKHIRELLNITAQLQN